MAELASTRPTLPLRSQADDTRPRRSPFRPVAPTLAAALVFGLAALVWAIAGARLPGGRWLAVHLFTLGVLTNLVLAFTDHFGRALARQPGRAPAWQAPLADAGILLVLVGLPTSTTWALGSGATLVTAAVLASWWRLRRMRHAAVGARFPWVLRTYERAHGAFVHGAVLGLLLGTGVLGGWSGAARLAHLHVNVLGWGGLTLLATLVFFGPTMVRTRIAPGADARAARALRWGATGLTVGVLALLATGAGGAVAVAMRVVAAGGLGLFATATTVVCRDVGRVAWAATPASTRLPVVAVTVWFPVLAWADVLVVLTGRWSLVDALGVGVLLGVLVQAVVATLSYLAPMLRRTTPAGRASLRARLDRGADVRAVLGNGGVVAIVAAAVVRDAGGAVLARVGWAFLVVALAWTAVPILAPRHRESG
jgi:hypothetical protein